jgi:hypothetical protein
MALQQQPQPVIIRIEPSTSSFPEWTMIEINGELVLPTEKDVSLAEKDQIELGSIRFDNNQVRCDYAS